LWRSKHKMATSSTSAQLSVAAAVLCLLAPMSAALKPGPCYAPEQFEGKAFYKDTARNIMHMSTADIAYDAINLRKRVRETYKLKNGSDAHIDIIQFYKEGIQYEINYYEQECKMEHLRSKFSYHSVVSNATWQGDLLVGSAAVKLGSVEIESWHAVHTSSEGVTRWKGTFTRSGCLPIRQVLIYPDDHVLSEDIMDITLGIADPGIFTVDKELCPELSKMQR